jgi:hypothetical protein
MDESVLVGHLPYYYMHVKNSIRTQPSRYATRMVIALPENRFMSRRLLIGRTSSGIMVETCSSDEYYSPPPVRAGAAVRTAAKRCCDDWLLYSHQFVVMNFPMPKRWSIVCSLELVAALLCCGGRLGRVLSAPWSVVVRESISWWFSSATCHDRAASGDNAEEFTRIWLHRLHLGRIEAPKILLGPRNISPPLTCWNPPAQSRSGSSNLASWETSAHLSTIGNRRSFTVEIWKRRANYRYHTCNFRTSFLTGLACFRSCQLSCSSFASWVGFCISSVDELMRKKSHQVVNTFTTRS